MTPSFFNTYEIACGVILASSVGSRLFPMTTKNSPKHLLPVAGVPSIIRLIESLSNFFLHIVITVADVDEVTLPTLLGPMCSDECSNSNSKSSSVLKLVKGPMEDDESKILPASNTTNNCSDSTSLPATSTWELKSEMNTNQRIYVLKLPKDCYGSVDALRALENTNLIDPRTRLVVFPGDLLILNGKTNFLEHLIRPPSDDIAFAAILVDVLEKEDQGLPLKESAKSKKGGLSRDEEDIEYIALSFPRNEACTSIHNSRNKAQLPRIVLKKSKLLVEEDDMTGSTSKLVLPKTKLRSRNGIEERIVIRTEWSDVHVYSLSPWVRKLIASRKRNCSSIQEDLLPLLISRQYRGKRATFGKSLTTTKTNNGTDSSTTSESRETIITDQQETQNIESYIGDESYTVVAITAPAKSALRINTVSAYLFACKEAVANDSRCNAKFQTLTLEGTILGCKINMKQAIVGRNCKLGDKCRLNNVVIMDNVTIGEQCSLHNTVIGSGATIANNCSLNDCQVAPGNEISSGTKAKGEVFMKGDFLDES